MFFQCTKCPTLYQCYLVIQVTSSLKQACLWNHYYCVINFRSPRDQFGLWMIKNTSLLDQVACGFLGSCNVHMDLSNPSVDVSSNKYQVILYMWIMNMEANFLLQGLRLMEVSRFSGPCHSSLFLLLICCYQALALLLVLTLVRDLLHSSFWY